MITLYHGGEWDFDEGIDKHLEGMVLKEKKVGCLQMRKCNPYSEDLLHNKTEKKKKTVHVMASEDTATSFDLWMA